ncbi:protein adenylyltransferase SelO [Comamonas sp. UBA7528]|uniref:protein adenylyltransferase SelO n=1 Tax=Comamonas sp. UBA7528 TaxID=1946391 RepID=UPI0025BA6EB9|nr:YdiU family protein [Comamonas sp. UBA7528]
MHAPASAPSGAPATSAAATAWQPTWNPHGFAILGPAFLTRLDPTPLPTPQLLAHSPDLAAELGIPAGWWHTEQAAQVLTGNRLLPGSQPYATVYSGHQFGVWAGQLGDGRAIVLGEVQGEVQGHALNETAASTDTGVAGAAAPAIPGWELQLKGAGRTPYSRRGDGRAVLRSSIREFLCSEAMHALGIPTTRALSLTGSPASIYREEVETAAVVCRVAPSFIRFGHFEHFAARGQEAELRQLADYVIDRYYPACRTAPGNPYAALLRTVAERTAEMLAHWQAVGFCHGVMNTDNMSILGLTIDYGPFQFLDGFDPDHICNHSDTQGRYAFRQQPQVAYWNLFCLGQALHPLIGEEDTTVAAIEAYRPHFSAAFAALMRRKLGLPPLAQTGTAAATPEEADPATPVVGQLLQLLAAEKVDYPIFWRRLSDAAATGQYDAVQDLFVDGAAWQRWLPSYQALLAASGGAPDAAAMQRANPRFVLRNHLGETAIRAAQAGDTGVLQQLQAVLAAPYDAHPTHNDWAGFPPDWASSISISCSS